MCTRVLCWCLFPLFHVLFGVGGVECRVPAFIPVPSAWTVSRSPEFSTPAEVCESRWWTAASSTTRSAAWRREGPASPSSPGTTRWTAQVCQTRVHKSVKHLSSLFISSDTCVVFVDFDGLFLSNGPGDPKLCQATIDNMRKVVCVERPKPLFGICLGHQLLSLVIGAKTYKMKLVLDTLTQQRVYYVIGLCLFSHYVEAVGGGMDYS